MHILYASQVRDHHLSARDHAVIAELRATTQIAPADGADVRVGSGYGGQKKDFAAAQDWVSAFFNKGADVVLGYYADNFVWEDIEFCQTITTKEDLYKAFLVFNNSGPDSPFGVHKFEVLTYDGGPAGASRGVTRQGGTPEGWKEGDYRRLADGILLGAEYDYDEWGYMQWVWKATHNEDFMGMPAKGKTTVTRGSTTQMYKDGKIVRCRSQWNFREFAMQLGVIPYPDEAWRENEALPG